MMRKVWLFESGFASVKCTGRPPGEGRKTKIRKDDVDESYRRFHLKILLFSLVPWDNGF